MIHFIKKIFENKVDEAVHSQFTRFGKGSFENKTVFGVRRNGKIKLNSTFELANELVLFAAQSAKKLKVNGIIFSKEPLRFEGKKKGGLFVYNVEKEFDAEEVKEILKKAYYLLLDCSGEGVLLKMKKKLPRPKPSGEAKVNDRFCILELDKRFWTDLKEEFLFGLPDAKKYSIKHSFFISEIILPSGQNSPEELRIKAKRKGKVIRIATIDGKEERKEKEFVA